MHLLVEEFLKDNLEFKLDILETLENHREEFIDWRRRPQSKSGGRRAEGGGRRAEGGGRRAEGLERAAAVRWPHARWPAPTTGPTGFPPRLSATARAHGGAPLCDAGPTGT